ncbi:probable helicase CHR10 isoform X3 [Amborella trichopoda]|uniref:probable helicase CHR10 isoform X3 n=1 Tax=Amborella trichopoda TaxID=13333 RepID=UPI0009BE266C|nr:probable helicase CHR10 isoform X3 [Amborella trichopoda]|eukprot:XP_020519289.1 probable helicase CHR10 isoform X3 [Amborella trichopoda]
MDYLQRLKAAAFFAQSRDSDEVSLNFDELGILGHLKPHQIHGVSWLVRRYVCGVNVILVVLCPLSVTDSWISEFTNFSPNLRILRYVGDQGDRRGLRKMMFDQMSQHPTINHERCTLPFDILLTTYDIAMLDKDFLSQIPWLFAIIDEAQRLKNPSSVLYRVLDQHYIIPRRLLLTGTPIQNNLYELWALLHFCMPLVFGTSEEFINTFQDAGAPLAGDLASKGKQQSKILKFILRAFMLRRTKALLVQSGTLILPPLTEVTMMAPLVPLQKKVYISILRKELPKILASSSGSSNQQSLQNIIMQLRKACSHGIEPEPFEEGEHLVQASGKLIILDLLLQKLHTGGHRVLLFAQMSHTLDILQDFLELRGHTYERLDGSVRAEERFAAIKSFSQQPVKGVSQSQTSQDNPFVFMISTRAGGVGLNLVAADTVIFYEQDWNPQVDRQALQRAHRIGQMNHVLSINLVTAGTVEEVIMQRAEYKLQLSRNVIGGDDGIYKEENQSADETDDLKSLVIFGIDKFEPSDTHEECETGINLVEVNAMAEKVLETRNYEPSQKEDRRFELNPSDLMTDGGGLCMKKSSASMDLNPVLDEASYLSWVEKFKEDNQSMEKSGVGSLNKRALPEIKHSQHEAEKKRKAEEKRRSKWEALGYQSFVVEAPMDLMVDDLRFDSGSVQFVFGDCTNPMKRFPVEPTVIFSCVDNSGKWGRGGMFDALAKLSEHVSHAYERAYECDDLHLGDLHLISTDRNQNVENKANMDDKGHQCVALAVVQSYNPWRKVPRNNISLPDLEQCLLKASFSASQKSASLHMPRIGYQDGSDRSDWYTVERLLRKYASLFNINIFVYYFRRPSHETKTQD